MTFPLGGVLLSPAHPLRLNHTAPGYAVVRWLPGFFLEGTSKKGKLEGDDSSARRVQGMGITFHESEIACSLRKISPLERSVQISDLNSHPRPWSRCRGTNFWHNHQSHSTGLMSINHRSSRVRVAWFC